MAESMQGLKRTARCAEFSIEDIGREVTVMGWVQKTRNKGGLIFTDVRDRSGIIQVIFEEDICGSEMFAKAATLHNEYCVAVTGNIRSRGKDVNKEIATGAIEVEALSLRILSEELNRRNTYKWKTASGDDFGLLAPSPGAGRPWGPASGSGVPGCGSHGSLLLSSGFFCEILHHQRPPGLFWGFESVLCRGREQLPEIVPDSEWDL